jgi:serine/threonine protein kinase
MASDITAQASGMRDDAIREFDNLWQQWRASRSRKPDGRPLLVDHVFATRRLPPAERADAIVTLVKIDLRHRLELNEFPTLAEYTDKVPGFPAEVRAAFEQMRPFDDYLLLTRLGSGGMGDVYLAHHLVLESQVALKILKGERLHDDTSIARFRQEVKSIGKLDHPHIVRARDAREIRGHQLLVMDYVDGFDLASVVRKYGAMPLPVACEAIRQAAEGLAHAHRLRIIHRDLKPSNIILSRDGIVKLLDFGLAKLKQEGEDQQSGLTKTGFMGTVDYMAPEQFEDASNVDHAADVYSLGCTLYHLLIEQAPFSNTGSSSLLSKHRAHAEAPIPSVRSQLRDCPMEVDALITRMMAKQPGDRPASAAAIATALAPFASATALQEFVQSKFIDSASLDTLPPGERATAPKGQAQTLLDTAKTKTRPPARFSRRFLIAGGLGAVALAGAGYGATQWLFAPPPMSSAIRSELVTLPGLSGNWWFREMPWLTPGVRHELAAGMNRGDAKVAGVPLATLFDGVRSGKDVHATYEQLAKIAHVVMEDKAASPEVLAFALLRDSENIEPKQWPATLEDAQRILSTNADNQPATHVHLLAVIAHERADWKTADASYRLALDKYNAAQQPELAALAFSDYCRMQQELGDARCVKTAFDAIATSPADAQLLKIHNGTLLVRCLAESDFEGANQQAKTTSEEAQKLLPPGHPLFAFALESLAWAQLDLLQLENARINFGEARRLRLEDADNPHARHYVLHDTQALGMCKYFLGEPAAKEELRMLVEKDFPAALRDARLTKRAVGELNTRFPNTCERYGDCLLFGGDQLYSPAKAAQAYDRAVQAAEATGVATGNNAPLVVRIRYKQVAALALAGQYAEARALLKVATVLPAGASGKLRVLEKEELQAIALYRSVAEAVVELDQDDPQRATALLQVLSKREEYVEKAGEVNRNEAGLFLVTARAIFKNCTDPATLEQAVKALDAVEWEANCVSGSHVKALRTRQLGEIRNYFAPYWQLARTAIDTIPADQRPESFKQLEPIFALRE